MIIEPIRHRSSCRAIPSLEGRTWHTLRLSVHHSGERVALTPSERPAPLPRAGAERGPEVANREISDRQRSWLIGELTGWHALGLVSSDQVASILDLYGTPEEAAQRRGARALFTLTSLAALLVGLAALLLIGYNWEAMPSAFKLAIIFGVLLATHCGRIPVALSAWQPHGLGDRVLPRLPVLRGRHLAGRADLPHQRRQRRWILVVGPRRAPVRPRPGHAALARPARRPAGALPGVLDVRARAQRQGMALVPGTPRPGWLQRAPAGPAGDPLGLSQVVAADRRPLRPAAGLVGDPATLRLAIRGQPGLFRRASSADCSCSWPSATRRRACWRSRTASTAACWRSGPWSR